MLMPSPIAAMIPSVFAFASSAFVNAARRDSSILCRSMASRAKSAAVFMT